MDSFGDAVPISSNNNNDAPDKEEGGAEDKEFDDFNSLSQELLEDKSDESCKS